MSFYQKKINSHRSGTMCVNLSGNPRFSSKADAILDGVGTLLDIFPDPRPRTIRAFVCYPFKRPASVKDAISRDWAVIGQDMWTAIKVHDHEESTEEAAATRSESPIAR